MAREEKSIPQCDECEHFVAWRNIFQQCPDDYNPCRLGHRMNFKMPENGPHDEWGLYRRGCRDRKVAPPAKAEKRGPIPAPPPRTPNWADQVNNAAPTTKDQDHG